MRPCTWKVLQLVFRTVESQGKDAASGSCRVGNSKAKERWGLSCGCIPERWSPKVHQEVEVEV